MDGLIEPSPLSEKRDWRPVYLGVGLVVIVMGVVVVFLRPQPKIVHAPDPYTANVKISDIKMSVAENFVGASFTYIDGTVTNAGSQTVTRATAHIVFRDSIGQVAQAEDFPLKILQTSGPYPDTVELSMSPLAPGQSKRFRLTFEHISAEWNHAYPEVQITDVSVKQARTESRPLVRAASTGSQYRRTPVKPPRQLRPECGRHGPACVA
jgi:Protein of unknown function (DUF2393)